MLLGNLLLAARPASRRSSRSLGWARGQLVDGGVELGDRVAQSVRRIKVQRLGIARRGAHGLKALQGVELPQLGLALAVILVGMARQGTLTPGHVGLLVLMLAAAIGTLYAVWFALTTTAFWFVKVDNVSELFTAFFAAGRFPVSAYPGWVRALLTFVVPVAFLTTVPAEAAAGRLTWAWGLGAVGVAALLLALSQALWRYALANYTSASS